MSKIKKRVKRSGVKTVKAAGKARLKAKKPSAVKCGGAAAFSKKEILDIRAGLCEMRNNIAKAVEDKKALDMTEPQVGDSIDQAAQSLDKEILFELSDNERTLLDSIEAALRKIENGTYGICEHCKSRIEKKRLKALPAARYCLPCQSGAEKNRMQ